jgi:hypothetical protein
VGKRAAQLCGVPVVAQSTANRDRVAQRLRELADSGAVPDGWEPPAIDLATFGKPESEITHVVNATAFVDAKRASMRAHASQMGPDHFLLAMADGAFASGMGVESYVVDPPPAHGTGPDLFVELFTPMRRPGGAFDGE